MFNLNTVFGDGGGSSKQLWDALLDIVKSKWGKFTIGAIVIGVALLFGTKYALDAGTKTYIESHMAFPAPLCQRTARDRVLLFIHGWNGDLKETWQAFPQLACDDPRLSRTEIISVGYPTYMRASGYTSRPPCGLPGAY